MLIVEAETELAPADGHGALGERRSKTLGVPRVHPGAFVEAKSEAAGRRAEGKVRELRSKSIGERLDRRDRRDVGLRKALGTAEGRIAEREVARVRAPWIVGARQCDAFEDQIRDEIRQSVGLSVEGRRHEQCCNREPAGKYFLHSSTLPTALKRHRRRLARDTVIHLLMYAAK